MLQVKRINLSELKRQAILSVNREKRDMLKQKNHFYVIDCETTGTKRPEPIYIAGCRYEKGVCAQEYKQFFMPERDITEEAEKIHGLNVKRLRQKYTRKFTNDSASILAEFLNEYPNIPIVAHGVKFDRDKVLKPAFRKVNK